MISLYIEKRDAESVTLEGRRVPLADVARIVRVGAEDFAALSRAAPERHGLWGEDL